MNIKQYFNQPYPALLNQWKVVLGVTFFIGAFIFVFQPFGLSEYHENNRQLVFLGYPLITFLVLFINLICVRPLKKKWFDPATWTLKKQIYWLCWILLTIASINFIYSSFIFRGFFHIERFLTFQFFTLTIGVLPITIITVINKNLQLSYNLNEANRLNLNLSGGEEAQREELLVSLFAENGKDVIEMQLSEMLYIESKGNYLRIFSFSNGRVESQTLRSSLKRIEQQLDKVPSLIRCHRAFIVNMNVVTKAEGNSQGLRLSIANTDIAVPASRSYVKNIRLVL